MMVKLSVSDATRASVRADALAAVILRDRPLFPMAGLDAALQPHIKKSGEPKTGLPLPAPSGYKADHLLVVSADAVKQVPVREKAAAAVAEAMAYACSRGWSRIAVLAETAGNLLGPMMDGALLGAYAFDRYKSKKEEEHLELVFLVRPADRKAAETLLQQRTLVASSVNRCRDLVNEPSNVMGTDAFLEAARSVARECGFKIRVLEKEELKKQGYNGLLTVGAAGHEPPRMIILEHRPEKPVPGTHLCLVGKGIVFDSGGISLKPADDMWTMKGDMAGAAAVLHGLRAIHGLRSPVRTTAILCLAENLPDSNAARPGDIFRARNGKTVMVENTDAEGRLVLSDGLFMAGELKATHVADFATLTGACVVALGEHIAGLMGNDDRFQTAISAAAESAGERVWRLPLPEDYRPMLDTPVADIRNVTGVRWGGAITGGLFISEFAPPGAAWAHVDIAGPAFLKKKKLYMAEGATGFGVRTITELPGRLA